MLTGRTVPHVAYSMPVTTFTANECITMITVFNNKVMFNKLGFNRKMPLVVMYSPYHMGGYNYPCFQIIQDQRAS